jgi:NTP pyrophosphatase (non-canonical NTP hydrolase)
MTHSNISFRHFSRANRERCEATTGFNHPVEGWSEAEWLAAATGELGEVAHVVKKMLRERDNLTSGTTPQTELAYKLGEEIADTIIYLDLLAQRSGVYIGDAIARKFNAKSDEIGSEIRL